MVFEPEFAEALKDIFEQRIVFNQVLGLKIVSIAPERVVGGLAVMAAMGARHMDEPVAQRLHRFGKLLSCGSAAYIVS